MGSKSTALIAALEATLERPSDSILNSKLRRRICEAACAILKEAQEKGSDLKFSKKEVLLKAECGKVTLWGDICETIELFDCRDGSFYKREHRLILVPLGDLAFRVRSVEERVCEIDPETGAVKYQRKSGRYVKPRDEVINIGLLPWGDEAHVRSKPFIAHKKAIFGYGDASMANGHFVRCFLETTDKDKRAIGSRFDVVKKALLQLGMPLPHSLRGVA